MSPSLPRHLGRYEVVEVIGTGAFATVYRARDDRLDADVAIKVLAENHSFDPDLRERFITEGHLLRRVDSPHVVKVFDLGETDAGQPFLVLDLAAGGDLVTRRRNLKGRGNTLTDLLMVARQVAAALDALHAERVVHRDVTPGNMLIHGRSDGPLHGLLGTGERLMLADLGLSKDLAAASGLTAGAGTAGFTPPEQSEGGWVDPRADIWSASALLVWLVLGAVPKPGGAWRDQLAGHGWPPALIDELGQGLATQPADRHPTAAAWVDALESATRPPPAPMQEPVPVAPPPASSSRRRLGRAIGALILAVLLLAGGWWLGRQGGDVEVYGRTRTERLAAGQARATATGAGARISITGPESVPVGRRATFSATTSGTQHFQWLAPDGRSYEDEPSLVVQPSSEGVTIVRLLGQTADGDVTIAELRVSVRPAS